MNLLPAADHVPNDVHGAKQPEQQAGEERKNFALSKAEFHVCASIERAGRGDA